MASSFSTLWFLLLCCFSNQIAESQSTELHAVSKSFCSRECEKQTEQADDKYIPLYQCSCSPSCSVYGDCCFDSPYRNSTTWRNRNYICLSVVGHERYVAVSSCPPGRANDFCKDGLGHLPPVTSRVTNVTYANILCALCNDDNEDLTVWDVTLRCSANVSSGGKLKYIYKSRNIWSLNEADGSKAVCKYYIPHNDSSFLEGLELRTCSLNAGKKSRCSSSWKDSSVFKACRTYEDPVYFQNTAYRNAHCALCNYMDPQFAECIPSYVKSVLGTGMVDDKVKKFCKTRGSDACINTLWDRARGSNYAFADLLNINEKACVPPAGKRCCRGEAFNRITQRCRRTHTD